MFQYKSTVMSVVLLLMCRGAHGKYDTGGLYCVVPRCLYCRGISVSESCSYATLCICYELNVTKCFGAEPQFST